MTSGFRVSIEDEAMVKYLTSLDAKGVKKVLRKGMAKGGAVYKKAIAAEAPVKSRSYAGATGTITVRKRGGGVGQKSFGVPGDLRRSVRVSRIRDVSQGIGVYVGPMGKLAFMRHWIVGGTKAHLIRASKKDGLLRLINTFARVVHHPGAKANPFVTRGAARAEAEALRVAEETIFAEAEKGVT